MLEVAVCIRFVRMREQNLDKSVNMNQGWQKHLNAFWAFVSKNSKSCSVFPDCFCYLFSKLLLPVGPVLLTSADQLSEMGHNLVLVLILSKYNKLNMKML